MNYLKLYKPAAVAAVLVVAGHALALPAAEPEAASPTAAPPAAPNEERVVGFDLSQKVDFKLGATQLRDGDNITIEEVYGTSSEITGGNLYLVKGTYRLSSEKNANLSVYVTHDVSNRFGGGLPSQSTQQISVAQGAGRFSLIFYFWKKGNPHVSFYGGGKSFGNVYFGTGDSLFAADDSEKSERAAIKTIAGGQVPTPAQLNMVMDIQRDGLEKMQAQIDADRRQLAAQLAKLDMQQEELKKQAARLQKMEDDLRHPRQRFKAEGRAAIGRMRQGARRDSALHGKTMPEMWWNAGNRGCHGRRAPRRSALAGLDVGLGASAAVRGFWLANFVESGHSIPAGAFWRTGRRLLLDSRGALFEVRFFGTLRRGFRSRVTRANADRSRQTGFSPRLRREGLRLAAWGSRMWADLVP